MHHKNKAPKGEQNAEGNPLLSPKRKAPAFFLYANDYASDNKLAQVSLAAQGLWVRMLCAMWVSDRQGYLVSTSSGKAPSIATIAITCRSSEAETEKLIKELEANEVFSRTEEGVIYSRRMLRDIEFKKQAIASGKTGGNPLLKAHKTINGNHNGTVNGYSTKGVKGRVNSKNALSTSISPSGLYNPQAPLKGGRRSKVTVSKEEHGRGF
jgi:hypothetical protein